MTKQTLTIVLACIAGGAAGLVAALGASSHGVAALYVTAFAATVLLCGLEYLRKAPG